LLWIAVRADLSQTLVKRAAVRKQKMAPETGAMDPFSEGLGFVV
jgi:hypothetical protein